MSIDYHIYNANNGNLISDTRHAGLPFLWDSATEFIHNCVIRKDSFYHIEEWSIDKNSKLYEEEMSKSAWERGDTFAIYCSKKEVLELQKLMTCNESVLQELMEFHNCDGIIVEIL